MRATDPVNNGTATAALTLAPYAPPDGMSVNPAAGSAAAGLVTFTVTDPAGGNSVTDVQMLIHTTSADAANACYIRVRPGSAGSPPNAMQLGVNSGTGWYGPIAAGTAGGVLYNSQCQMDVAGALVTASGNALSVAMNLTFKPGFTGMKNIYMKATNSTGASTYWAQVGTRDLSTNPAALAPTISVASPATGATVAGTINISGWALDNATRSENDITSVAVYVDNVLNGYATLGQSSTACNTYPGRPGCPSVGFTYALNTGLLSNGAHALKVVAADFDVLPHTAEIVQPFTVNNVVPLAVVVTPANSYARMNYSGVPVDTKQFAAVVGGTPSTAVNWSLTPLPAIGGITTAGLYTPPNVFSASPGTTVTVSATRQANPSDVGSTTVTLMGLLSPPITNLTPNQSAWFSTSMGSVTFGLSPNVGIISSTGIYTAPASFTPGTVVTITATAANPTQRQQALVTLVAP